MTLLKVKENLHLDVLKGHGLNHLVLDLRKSDPTNILPNGGGFPW